MEISESNPGILKKLRDNLKAVDGVQGKVGWLSGAYDTGIPVATVAAMQEFGVPSRSIPPRPFMRPTITENENAWAGLAARVSGQVVEGKMSASGAMTAITLQAEGDVSAKISSITSPPLSKITLGVRKYKQLGKKVTGATIGEIARLLHEGKLDVSGVSTKPLNDTGTMIGSLTHVVESA